MQHQMLKLKEMVHTKRVIFHGFESNYSGSFESAYKRRVYASYLYLSMSAHCDSLDLPGFAHWMRIQSQEEYAHAMNLFDYVQDRQGKVTLLPIDQPVVEFGSVLDVMEATLAHERQVSHLINELYELASRGKRLSDAGSLAGFHY